VSLIILALYRTAAVHTVELGREGTRAPVCACVRVLLCVY